MTFSRFGGKWREEREYAMGGGGTQRLETVSKFKNGNLQYKAREVYKQFGNWGETGEVYEAMVQKVEDPDWKALATNWEYWDTTALPGNLSLQINYPDGYWSGIPPASVSVEEFPRWYPMAGCCDLCNPTRIWIRRVPPDG